ncbi:hypothetical protein LissoIVSPER_00003 [Lissonota sp. PSUC_FEM 10030012]|nr:hypothetical protein [Lissonota sp. PSUC_FEM 10030012]
MRGTVEEYTSVFSAGTFESASPSTERTVNESRVFSWISLSRRSFRYSNEIERELDDSRGFSSELQR